MSIDHKAYLFRHTEFQKELGPLLYRALKTGKVTSLRQFIHGYRDSLTDLGTGKPLPEDWEEKIGREQEVQRYADLALTRYYNLTENLGLSYGFDALGAFLQTIPALGPNADRFICGNLFGPKGKRLDPGFMGTGLVAPPQVAQFARLLSSVEWPIIPGPDAEIYSGCYYKPESAEEVQQSLEELRKLYDQAAQAELGLLFGDFNDCDVGGL
jgi:hypothetical protein